MHRQSHPHPFPRRQLPDKGIQRILKFLESPTKFRPLSPLLSHNITHNVRP